MERFSKGVKKMSKVLTDKDIKEIYRGERGVGCNYTLFTEYQLYEVPERSRCIEIGFGQGELARYLIEKENYYVGIDCAVGSVGGAIKDKFFEKAVFLYMDASNDNLPFLDDTFEHGFCLETLEHLANPIHAVLELKRVLMHGAKLSISVPKYEVAGYEAGTHSHIYPGLLTRENFTRFMIQLYFKPIRYIDNGGAHLFLFENIKDAESFAFKERGSGEEKQPNIFRVVAGNYGEHELYGHLGIPGIINLYDAVERKEIQVGELEKQTGFVCKSCGVDRGYIYFRFDDPECELYMCKDCRRVWTLKNGKWLFIRS